MSLRETLSEIAWSWSLPKPAIHAGETIPFRLACELSPRSADQAEVEGFLSLPEGIRNFWLHHESARLFVDVDFGQWGLELLSPKEARAASRFAREERPVEFLDGDLVIGRFLGDTDLLVARISEGQTDFGEVLVALPLDGRADWYRVASSFEDFLQAYLLNQGEKYWERRA